MNVLVFTCGSSSLKFQGIRLNGSAASGEPDRRLARGLIERIGGEASCTFQGREGRISPANVGIHVYVIPSDEEILIARDTAGLLQN